MSESIEDPTLKRPLAEAPAPVPKLEKQEEAGDVQTAKKIGKKRIVILMMYLGANYQGMQRNPDAVTIEEELRKALKATKLVSETNSEDMTKYGFQRAARTDKGVSAVGQCVSLRAQLPDEEEEVTVARLNEHLPEDIRVFGVRVVTGGFNPKNACMKRTYTYLIPTKVLCPFLDNADDYVFTENEREHVNKILAMYEGTRNYWNYTSRIAHNEAQANRYIMSFKCSKPFVNKYKDEFVVCTVIGQSFLLHHIRKMIGMMIAVKKGYAPLSIIPQTFTKQYFPVPFSPGLGLVLEETHYESYNKRYPNHADVSFVDYADVRDEYRTNVIYDHIFQIEHKEKRMAEWVKEFLDEAPHNFYRFRESFSNEDLAQAITVEDMKKYS